MYIWIPPAEQAGISTEGGTWASSVDAEQPGETRTASSNVSIASNSHSTVTANVSPGRAHSTYEHRIPGKHLELLYNAYYAAATQVSSTGWVAQLQLLQALFSPLTCSMIEFS